MREAVEGGSGEGSEEEPGDGSAGGGVETRLE